MTSEQIKRRIRMADLALSAMAQRLHGNNEQAEAYLERINEHKKRLTSDKG